MLSQANAYEMKFLFPTGDSVIGASLKEHGEFARPEVDIICDYLKLSSAPGTFVDVGANIGSICLPVARRFPDIRVCAIEAHRGLHAILAANILNNGLFNVDAVQAAVGPEIGIAQFPATSLRLEGNFGTIGMHMNARVRTENTRMCTLDEIAPPDTRFIKMDVEGFEIEVLKGATATVNETRPAWLVEANSGLDSVARACMQVYLEADYRLYWFFAPFVTGKTMRDKLTGDTNFIAAPKDMPNLWNLTEISSIDAERPTHMNAYRYLERYG